MHYFGKFSQTCIFGCGNRVGIISTHFKRELLKRWPCWKALRSTSRMHHALAQSQVLSTQSVAPRTQEEWLSPDLGLVLWPSLNRGPPFELLRLSQNCFTCCNFSYATSSCPPCIPESRHFPGLRGSMSDPLPTFIFHNYHFHRITGVSNYI